MERADPSRPTIFDVAAESGVSRSTVSRVLQNDQRVADATREKVQRAVAKLGYVPNAAARHMRSPGRRSIGLLIRNISSPYYAKLNSFLQTELRTRGYHVVQESVIGQHPVDERELLENLISLRVQGVIIASGSVSEDLISEWAPRLPLLVLGREVSDPTINYIAHDEKHNGRLIADRLHELGHRNVVVETTPQDYSWGSHTRSVETIRRCRELGMEVTEHSISTVEDPAHTYAVVQQTGASVVACLHDPSLVKLWELLLNDAQRVPDDLNLFGSDGVSDAIDILGLSTIRRPVEELAKQGAEVILRLIDKHKAPAPVRRTLPGTLVPGRTTIPFRS